MTARNAGTAAGCLAAAMAASLLIACTSGAEGEGEGGGAGMCVSGEMQSCPCADGTSATQTCRTDGLGFGACLCPIAGGMSGPLVIAPGVAGSSPPPSVVGGTMSVPPPPPPPAAGVGGLGGAGGMSTVAGAGAGGLGGAGGMMVSGGSGGVGSGGTTSVGEDDMDALRQVCVDYINMYRATLGVAALARATPAQEACSDMGAQKDGTSGQAHGSAGDCDGLGGQDTCPGWGVGGFSGNSTLGDALTGCLDQMWAEGPPPVPEQECIQDYQNCFLVHGHWMNMSNDDYKVVSCGFYKMSDGKWWMNQDFGF